MGMLETLFPACRRRRVTPWRDIGDFFDGLVGFFGSSGPCAGVDRRRRAGQDGPQRPRRGHGSITRHGPPGSGRRAGRPRGTGARAGREARRRVVRAVVIPARQFAIRSFADVADESSKVLTENARNIERQVDGFERMKNSLERGCPTPPPTKGAFNPDFSGRRRRNASAPTSTWPNGTGRSTAATSTRPRGNVGGLKGDYGPLPESFDGRTPGLPAPGGMPDVPGGQHGGVKVPDFRPPGGVSGWPDGSGPGGGSGGYGSGGYQPGRLPAYDGTTAAAAFGPGRRCGGRLRRGRGRGWRVRRRWLRAFRACPAGRRPRC